MFRSLVLAAVAALALPLAQPAAVQARGVTISTPFGPSETVPDPRAAYNGWLSNSAGVTETLMGIDYEMNLYPRLAESIEKVSPTTWRVTLRDGTTFHDGSPVTADAVVASFAAIMEEGNSGYNARLVNLLDLAGFEADGDSAIVFETNNPNAAFPYMLSAPGVAILGTPSDDYPINATGPYVFREAVPGQLYRAEANAGYRLGTPGFSDVRVVVSADPATAALAFEAGEVDMVIGYPENDFERIQETGAQGFAEATGRLYFYLLNARSGPLADPLIRQAVSHAIDRDGIVEAALSGVGGVAAETFFPEGTSWASDAYFTYDSAKAEALLAEAGAVKDGGVWTLDGEPLEIGIATYSSRTALPPTAALTQAYLQAIGVRSKVQLGEYGAMVDALTNGEVDMFLKAAVTTPQGDPGVVLELQVGSEGSANAGGYSNAELDQLLADGRTTFDPAERKAIFDKVQKLIYEDGSMIPVFHASQVVVAVPELRGYQVHPTETYWLTHETTFSE